MAARRAWKRGSIPCSSELFRTPDSVEYVSPERMPLGDRRVVEVIGLRSRHSDPLHDGPRSEIRCGRERDDLLQSQVPEAEFEGRAGGLGGVAAAPMRAGQPPADLDAGREVRLE